MERPLPVIDGPPLDAIEQAHTMFDHTQIPDTGIMRELAREAAELAKVDDLIKKTDSLLEDLKAKRNKLVTQTLPDLFDRCMTDRIGVPEEGVDVALETHYHAAIRADWSDEQRDAGFDELERAEAGDLIKCVLTITFGRGELGEARRVAEFLRAWNEFQNRPISIRRDVAWNTLTSWFKGEIEDGDKHKIDREKIGARTSRQAKLIRRKK